MKTFIKYTQEQKEDYYMNKFLEMERKNTLLRQSVVNAHEIDKIGSVYVVKGSKKCNQLNNVLSSEEYIKNDYKSKYYAKRSTGMDHHSAVKELHEEFQRKVAISSRDWTNLKLAERDSKLL